MNWRKRKRIAARLFKRLRVGSYFTDCNNHPCVVEKKGFSYQDVYGSYVDGVSLCTNAGTSCSLLHCSPEPISRELANEMVKTWQEGGDKALAIKYSGWSPETYDEFAKVWRS